MKEILVTILSCITLVFNTFAGTEPEEIYEVNGTLEVHYIDVGQADATLIMTDGHNMLIDGGNTEDSSLIYTYLKEKNATKLDYMICTHAHEDHAGGLAGALNYAEVENVYCPVKYYDSEAFQNFAKYVKIQGKEIIVPEAGMEFDMGEVKCKILGVNTEDYDPNNTSIVLKVQYGGVSLHKQSHGESFMALVENRFWGNGLYILDEPEAALSPILMTFPGAEVLEITEDGINPVDYC